MIVIIIKVNITNPIILFIMFKYYFLNKFINFEFSFLSNYIYILMTYIGITKLIMKIS